VGLTLWGGQSNAAAAPQGNGTLLDGLGIPVENFASLTIAPTGRRSLHQGHSGAGLFRLVNIYVRNKISAHECVMASSYIYSASTFAGAKSKVLSSSH
jgi:hypothetical protein